MGRTLGKAAGVGGSPEPGTSNIRAPQVAYFTPPTKLQYLLDQRQLSYSTVAKATGISATMIGQYASGKTRPPTQNLIRLCQYLHCNTIDLLGRCESSTSTG